MSNWKIINADSSKVIREYINDKTIIVTDPPFNIGYHYNGYKDRLKTEQYLKQVGDILSLAPSVLIHYPEDVVRLSMQINKVPNRIVSWVYNSNTKRQHRDIAFYGFDPDFSKVKQPYKNPNDKRIKALIANGSQGTNIYDWWNINQIKNVSKEKTIHPCQMPLEVMDRIIKLLPQGVNVIDPYCGSGTTGIACVNNNIDFIGIDIVPEYAKLAEERIREVEINDTNIL
jgi:DNA modification methylase